MKPNPPTAALGVSLSGLFPKACADAGELRVTGVSSEAAACRPGDLFVPAPGDDGPAAFAQAARRGAVAALACQRSEAAIPVFVVPDTREALGRVCQALAGHPSRRMKVIAVAGAHGKTTAGYLIASVLGIGGRPTAVMGTLGATDGAEARKAAMSTPPAPMLADWLARSEANGCTHAALEVSASAIAASRIAGIRFDTACVTNLEGDESQVKAIDKLLDQLSPEGVAVFNADDPGCEALLDSWDAPALTVGIDSAAEISAEPVEQTPSDQTFLLVAGDNAMPVRTTLLGKHNIYHCLTAAAVGLAHGLDLFTVVRGLEDVESIPGRLERLECGQPFGVYVDVARSPERLATALRTLRGGMDNRAPGRVICVAGCGEASSAWERARLGRTLAQGADVTFLAPEAPEGLSAANLQSLLSGFGAAAAPRLMADRREAIVAALREAMPGDRVLIAGQRLPGAVQDVGPLFDERQFTRGQLYEGVYETGPSRVVA